MLHVDPKMVIRLDEIEEDLLLRRQRVETEGLDLTLSFPRSKRQEANRLGQLTIQLETPTLSTREAQ
ncbi:hypothetical protein [Nocardia sp. NPDC005998]|uniref:hypothetical protein n=1 Tax=Nocardia sp. NPDC005998 TaxID=3156894 RepID=UPI0033BD1648